MSVPLVYVLAAFLYPALFALVNIIDSHLSNQTIRNPWTLIFYMSLTNWLFIPLILFFGMPDIPSGFLLFCYFILAFLDLLYQVPYYKAVKQIDISIVGALFSLGRIFIPVLTYLFLDERLHLSQYIGFILIIFSSIVLSIQNLKLPQINQAFFLMLLSSSIRSVYSVLEKYTIDVDGNWINMVVYPAFFAFLIPFCLFLFKADKKDIINHFGSYKKSFKSFALIELLAFIATSVLFFILPHISAVLKTSVSATMPVFVLLFAFLLNKFWGIKTNETLTRAKVVKKIVCFTVMTAGVVLLVR